MNNLKTLAVICSVGSLCIVFGLILDIPIALQFILLIIGLLAGIVGIISLTKLLLRS